MKRRGGTGGRTRPVAADRDAPCVDADTTTQPGPSRAVAARPSTEATTESVTQDEQAVRAEDLAAVEAGVLFQDDEAALAAAAALERREGDRQLRDTLAQHDFTGTVWAAFEIELLRYGLAVVNAWLLTGEIFVQCRRKRCSPGPAPEVWDPADRESVANHTVAQAVKDFTNKALRQGRWKADGGASLKTYFIGACVFAFPNAYRAWQAEQAQFAQSVAVLLKGDGLDLALDPDAGARLVGGDPQDAVINKMTVWPAFDAIPEDRTKSAILLQEGGYGLEEIAELLQMPSANAVKQLLHLQRARGRQHHDHRRGLPRDSPQDQQDSRRHPQHREHPGGGERRGSSSVRRPSHGDRIEDCDG